MNIYEVVIVNIIFIVSPFLVYLFYVAYNKNIFRKGNELFLEIAIFSSLYLVLKYCLSIGVITPILIINIPLIIAFWYKRRLSSLIVSIVLIIYYYTYFNFDLTTLVLEYLFYYVAYLIFLKYKHKQTVFINVFIIFKSIMILSHIKMVEVTVSYIEWIPNIIIFYLSTILVIFLIAKGDNIIRYHMNIKKIKEEKQIQTSLFKISHEIKNPIAVCKGYLDMFDCNNKEHIEKYIPIIKSEIERTLVLLQDFLVINKVKLTEDILDVDLLLENVIKNFESLMEKKKIKLNLNCDLDEEIFIYGDYNRLEQVLINIFKNSIEAIDKEGFIKLDVEELEKDVKITIKDDGIGIDNIEKIYEPFYTTKKMGTGLGVPLSVEIIKAHKGKLKYESEFSKGTTVTIILPKNHKKTINSY